MKEFKLKEVIIKFDYFHQAYFQEAKLDVNLIIVNWERFSHTLNYITARNSVEDTGVRVATLIDVIIENTKVRLDDISLIGFSLGAHIAGHGNFKYSLILY